MQFRLIILIALIISSCSRKPKENEVVEFVVPNIVNSMLADSSKSKLFSAESISETFPVFVGKYSFQDTIIDVNQEVAAINSEKDRIHEAFEVGIKDSIDANGFEMVVLYDMEISYKRYNLESSIYYPVFFVNSTNNPKIFFGKDGYVFGIQEGRESRRYGSWRPIETRGVDFCGNGHWGKIVYPNEYILILMRKYDGNFETELRERIQNGESLYVSKPFKGFVNESQFKLDENSTLKKRLIESKGRGANWLFYGAYLNEEEWQIASPEVKSQYLYFY